MSDKMNNSEHHADVSQQKEPKQSLEEEKASLKRQIQTLRNLKSEAQQTLHTLQDSRNDFSQTNDISGPQLKTLPAGNLAMKNELFYFAGIQGIKCIKDEFIFNFVTKGEGNETYVYSVQIFNVDNKGELGKWVLPIHMNIELILKETPLDNLTRAAHFIRNCKHHIDCYHRRMDQLIALKKSMEDVANCFPVGSLTPSYHFINIQLRGVYDAELNNKIDIEVYLKYNLKETRPKKIEVDTVLCDTRFNEKTEKDLISYLKPFEELTLIEAFESIEKDDDSRFSWKRIYKDRNFLNTREYQDSEQSSFEQSSSEQCEPERKRSRKSSLRRSQENSTKNELIQKVKRRGEIKRKMRINDLEYRKRSTKSNKRNSVVKTVGAIQRRNNKKYQKPNAADISKFLTQYQQQPESEKESSSKESQPSRKYITRHTKETAKLSKLTSTEHIEIKGEVNQKKTQRKNPLLEKINEHETSEERRVLRSTDSTKKTNSPQKSVPNEVTSPKKINSPKKSTSKKVVTPKKMDSSKKSPQKITPKKKGAPRKRLVTPKKIAVSKKAAFSKITISPNPVKTKMKQTNLKFPIPSRRTPTRNQKVVTSTPMPLLRKNVTETVETDLDISNIASNINEEASKINLKSSVFLKKLEKIRVERKETAKNSKKKTSPMKK